MKLSNLGIASIGAISLGAIIVFTAFDSDLAGFGAISMILIGPALGTIALLNLPAATYNKRKAIETFNYGKIYRITSETRIVNLNRKDN